MTRGRVESEKDRVRNRQSGRKGGREEVIPARLGALPRETNVPGEGPEEVVTELRRKILRRLKIKESLTFRRLQ